MSPMETVESLLQTVASAHSTLLNNQQRSSAAFATCLTAETDGNCDNFANAVKDLKVAASDFSIAGAELICALGNASKRAKRILGTAEKFLSETSTSFDSNIVLWNDSQSNRGASTLINVQCGNRGKAWATLEFFLKIVCNFSSPVFNSYCLVEYVSGKAVNLAEVELFLLPGVYGLVPREGAVVLQRHGSGLPIVPRGSTSEDHSETFEGARKRKRVSSTFRESLLQRDNHCVVSRETECLEASHIVARAYWDEYHRTTLPEHIVTKVSGLEGRIDNVRNGILLSRDLSSAFDRGKISFRFENGHYYLIAFTKEAQEYDGVMMDENLRLKADGCTWWFSSMPDRELMEFHLRNSVFLNCCGRESDVHSDDEDLDVDGISTPKFIERRGSSAFVDPAKLSMKMRSAFPDAYDQSTGIA